MDALPMEEKSGVPFASKQRQFIKVRNLCDACLWTRCAHCNVIRCSKDIGGQ